MWDFDDIYSKVFWTLLTLYEYLGYDICVYKFFCCVAVIKLSKIFVIAINNFSIFFNKGLITIVNVLCHTCKNFFSKIIDV